MCFSSQYVYGIFTLRDLSSAALTQNYKLVVDYGPSASRTSDPDIHWKLKWKDPLAVKIIPEAPLWGIEKELCRRDPETFDYVRRPPATGVKKSSRKSRPASASMASPDAKRRSFTEPVALGGRGSRGSAILGKGEGRRDRSRGPPLAGPGGRSRAGSFEERSTIVREEMPHRRERGKAWWEGTRSPEPGDRSPRRSSMRV